MSRFWPDNGLCVQYCLMRDHNPSDDRTSWCLVSSPDAMRVLPLNHIRHVLCSSDSICFSPSRTFQLSTLLPIGNEGSSVLIEELGTRKYGLCLRQHSLNTVYISGDRSRELGREKKK